MKYRSRTCGNCYYCMVGSHPWPSVCQYDPPSNQGNQVMLWKQPEVGLNFTCHHWLSVNVYDPAPLTKEESDVMALVVNSSSNNGIHIPDVLTDDGEHVYPVDEDNS